MGGRGGMSGLGGGGNGDRFLSSLPDYAMRDVENHSYMGNFGTKIYQIAYMKNNGVSDETIDEMNALLSDHGGSSAQQSRADAAIVDHLNANDDVGKALKMQIDMEEALYSKWKASNPNANDRVYRKGNRKSGVESWTTNDEGANMGAGGIGWDHSSTVSDMRAQGYRILGGMGRHLGAAGEAEVTFVKWKK